MITPAGASIDSASLALVVRCSERFAPCEDFYQENPIGVFRGLAFAIVFNLLLMLTGVAGWELWRLLR
jgi:hypothetical protein